MTCLRCISELHIEICSSMWGSFDKTTRTVAICSRSTCEKKRQEEANREAKYILESCKLNIRLTGLRD